MWADICESISDATGQRFSCQQPKAVGGGCINEAYYLTDGRQTYFVKTNRPERVAMFEAEAEGLREMSDADAIRVPKPIVWGVAGGVSFLVLENLKLGGSGDACLMGEQVAKMHRKTAERFGWHRDNTIGSTPQINQWEDDWVVFYRERRLRYQFDLAMRKGASFQGAEALMESVGFFFQDYTPVPSLLHGDLWGGNASFDSAGNPVLFDPATYYGDREADIAFTEMFGGFGSGFYKAYNATWELDKGYRARKKLYNLYHLLNHYNLFGGGYAGSAQSTIHRLLSCMS